MRSILYQHKNLKGVWQQKADIAFDEVIFSWNALRPSSPVTFFLKVFIDKWSKWIPIAKWGGGEQKSYSISNDGLDHDQDITTVKGFANQFAVKVLGDIDIKHMYVNIINSKEVCTEKAFDKQSLSIPITHAINQFSIDHPRNFGLCNPTSIYHVIRCLSDNKVDVLPIANAIFDQRCKIYGNWAFATAEAFQHLPDHCPRVKRLCSFSDIYLELKSNKPVIVSVKGIISNAAKPYDEGHLLVVRGWDASSNAVLCVDSAFKDVDNIFCAYPYEEFMHVWKNRKMLAYLF